MSLVKEKIKQAIGILDELEIDVWLTFVRESRSNPDPILDLIYGTSCTWHSAFMITRSGETVAIVGSLDVANTAETGAYEEVIGYVGSVREELLKAIDRFAPKRIAVNYSVDSVMADGLSHGMWLTLNNLLKGTDYSSRLVSSDHIIDALRGRKSDMELKRITASCHAAQEILETVSKFLKPGVTEKQVAAYIIEQMEKRKLEQAWDPTHCPAVFTGPESAGAHAGPTDRKVERGHILNVDFGVRKDGYCSDLQRTWYILREGEKKAPDEVAKGFKTIIEAIEKAASKIRPGVEGHVVDSAARGHITASGYEEYLHGLGHQVGRAAHDGGGLLAPAWERYGRLSFVELEAGNVFTIEPRLTVQGHGIVTVEEEVVVTSNGCRYLSRPQKEIYLVK